MIAIDTAIFPEDTDAVVDIWREYVASPRVSLEYQGNEAEFAALPGKYALPDGCVILARSEKAVFGCVAYRRVDARICEMKRLYVRPGARGLGLGERLIEASISAARAVGYSEMRLDVLAEFQAAQQLYEAFGFVDAEPVACNPNPGTRFLGLMI